MAQEKENETETDLQISSFDEINTPKWLTKQFLQNHAQAITTTTN